MSLKLLVTKISFLKTILHIGKNRWFPSPPLEVKKTLFQRHKSVYPIACSHFSAPAADAAWLQCVSGCVCSPRNPEVYLTSKNSFLVSLPVSFLRFQCSWTVFSQVNLYKNSIFELLFHSIKVLILSNLHPCPHSDLQNQYSTLNNHLCFDASYVTCSS